MPSSTSQRPAVRSAVARMKEQIRSMKNHIAFEQLVANEAFAKPDEGASVARMKEQISSMKKHIAFVEQPVGNAAVAKPDEDASKALSEENNQTRAPTTNWESSASLESSKRVPMQCIMKNQYEYQFVKPSDVAQFANDGWEVWSPKTTSSVESDDNDNDHNMPAESCTCESRRDRIRYGDVMHLRPERCVPGWGDWDTYRLGQIVEAHQDSKNWHAPSKLPLITPHRGGIQIDLVALAIDQTRGGLTLREAIDLYQEHAEQEEFEECDFCAREGAGSAKVLFKI
ncbi:hypothetical protein NW768_007593 [Fusarium equiseti]|uniref:Uncharacterized protein n=1 Tax=Fusarium equiseti TaxID=61235 RepID=A0ABQ8R820_FUSEQ|nr:hypothetical protein NW768_007593 [Fusarium equiseti]